MVHCPSRVVLAAAGCAVLVGVAACSIVAPGGEEGPDGIPVQISESMVVSDSVKNLLKADAARIHLRSRHSRIAEEPILVPQIDTSPYYNALLAAHRMEHPIRDTIAEIRTFPKPELHDLIVTVDAQTDWANAWNEGRTLTGYDGIDRLIRTYQFDLVSFDGEGSERKAILRSPLLLNLEALAPRFERVRGVRSAEWHVPGGEGDDISAVRGDGYVDLIYSIGLGDCTNRCDGRRWWIFRVRYDNRITYRGAYEK